MDRLKLVMAPVTTPVSVTEAKLNQRIDYTDDDDLIAILLGAAVGDAERFLGRALIEQTWDYYLDAFPADGGPIDVPLPPLLSVTGIYYTDDDAVEQEFASASYGVDTAKEKGRLYLLPSASWPTPRTTIASVRVRFRAGYLNESVSPSVENVPDEIKAAILLMFGSLYEHRESVIVGQTASLMPWGAEQLLRRHRVELGMA